MLSLNDLFERFVQERIYLQNVSDHTVKFYRHAWAALRKSYQGDELSKDILVDFMVHLRKSGLKPVSVNTYARALNAFFNWAHTNEHLKEKLVIKKLKEEKAPPKAVGENHLKAILAYKPQTFAEQRLYTILSLLIDTGMRIDCEALSLKRDDVDMDNLLITVKGKGGKTRIIPFSLEMRKILFKWMQKHNRGHLFPTRDGGKTNYHNIKRDYKILCRKLGLKDTGFHRLRHTFALQYIRAGGSIFHLQKQLGHESLEMTRRYTELDTRDLQAMHAKTSLLGRLRS